MRLKRLEKWYLSIKKYIFIYKDGCFQLPYLSNSPEIMVESLRKMPFTRYTEGENIIHSNNIFTSGYMRYLKVEEGLWLLGTKIKFKENICTKALYDKEPTEYYFLSHSLYVNEITFEDMEINRVLLPTNGWSLYRPGTEITAFQKKGASGLYLNIAFSKSWLEKNLAVKTGWDDTRINQYLNAENGILFWHDIVEHGKDISADLWERLDKDTHDLADAGVLKSQATQLINGFLEALINITGESHFFQLPAKEINAVQRAERFITDNLQNNFPGIEEIAAKVNLSKDKLTACFKQVYGNTIFQYFQEKQMQLAYEMLRHKKLSVKEVALMLKYGNQSKFTAAFRKYHQVSPSALNA